jgi:hypothetical protein
LELDGEIESNGLAIGSSRYSERKSRWHTRRGGVIRSPCERINYFIAYSSVDDGASSGSSLRKMDMKVVEA